jgi:excisionase family DNA binding protein
MMSVNPAKPTPLDDKFILTSEEAAEFLGISLRTIRYWVAMRRIPTSISDGSSGSSPPT